MVSLPREAKLSNVLGVSHANSLEWTVSATAQMTGLCLTPSPLSCLQLQLASSVVIASGFHCIYMNDLKQSFNYRGCEGDVERTSPVCTSADSLVAMLQQGGWTEP